MYQTEQQKADILLAQAIDLSKQKNGLVQAISLFEQAAQIYLQGQHWTAYLEAEESKVRLLLKSLDYSRVIKNLPPILEKIPHTLQSTVFFKKLQNHLATAYYQKGSFKKAQYIFEAILEIEQKAHGLYHDDVARIYGNIGNCHYSLSHFEKALTYYQQSLQIRRKVLSPNHPNLAFTYSALGRCFYQNRDFDTALLYYRKALDIRQQHYGEQHAIVTYSLADMALCYFSKGDTPKAIQYFKKTIAIRIQLWGETHPSLTLCYLNLGNFYRKDKDFEKAIAYYSKAAEVQEHTFGTVDTNVAVTFAQIGRCHDALNEHEKGVIFLKKALAIQQQVFGLYHEKVASVYDYLGRHFIAIKQFQEAAEHFQKSISSLFSDFKPITVFENPILKNYLSGERLMKALSGKAAAFEQLFFKKQDPAYLQCAFDTHCLIVAMTDKRRADYQAESAKFLFADEIYHHFEKAIQTAFTLAQHIPTKKAVALQAAFTFFEKSKAITLLSSMKEAEAKNIAEIPLSLLKKEQTLKQELSQLTHAITLEKQKTKATETPNKEQGKYLKQLENQQFDTHQAYTQVIQELEQTQPIYFQVKHNIDTATLTQVQAQLTAETTLIEYFVGEEYIYIFEVSAISNQEAQTGDFQVIASNGYALYKVIKPDNFSELLQELQQATEWMDEMQFAEVGHQLYQLLLSPILEKTQNLGLKTQNLILLPHAELLYLPFEALVTQKVAEMLDFHELPYLVKNYNVTYHYSATLWQHGIARQAVTKSLKDSFLGIAPVTFDGSEQKELAVESSEKTGFRSKVFRSTNATQNTFDSLPSSEVEVKAVYDLFQQKQKDAKALLYGAASKKNLHQFAPNHKYILISTHGFIQEDNAQLSGIHLAKPISSQQKKENRLFPEPSPLASFENFQLYTSEAYHLQLNADLVVLSSCESGIGQLHKGEGMVAINRAFIYAGASNIIFSLFEVPDDATGRLMPLLFEHILEGDDYAAALRKAKMALLQNVDFSPQDWAGFVLIGG